MSKCVQVRDAGWYEVGSNKEWVHLGRRWVHVSMGWVQSGIGLGAVRYWAGCRKVGGAWAR